MGQPSQPASNALIYCTYAAFLVFGLYVAWRLRGQSAGQWLSANRTQKAIPLALNFIASALGSAILFTYPNIAALAGLHGLLVYALSSGLPLLIFAALGPIIRRKCPDGFVLTQWTRERYGTVTSLYLSFFSCATIWLYMVAELSALQQVVNLLTGLNGLPALIVQAAITTTYTAFGGFRVSFVTDNIQGVMVLLFLIIGTITIAVTVNIDTSLISTSQYLEPNLLGWQLLYILPVAILTNDFFLSGFWLRAFAAKTDKDLYIGVSIAAVAVTIITTLVGVAGLIAGWSGVLGNPPEATGIELFTLLETLPAWVVGIILVMVVTLSTAAFDSLQSALISTGSNDFFRNKLNIWWVRAFVVVLIVPTVVVALKSPSVLQIYLISDIISAAMIPCLVIGLSSKAYWWRGFEVVVGGIGGIFTVFLFGLVYYDGDVSRAGNLLILTEGLYASDWSVFGAFVAAPVGGLLWALAAFILRISVQLAMAKVRGHRCTAFDRPAAPDAAFEPSDRDSIHRTDYGTTQIDGVKGGVDVKGKFF
ncbi:Putative sodium/solute symporter, sodium/glucose symporter superfamily [Septoria linicola]|uniref:Sodium/solute symporter, sodium/glucose symporter superfamily n=1 Tax=Septoria linicola TaxID=215465 RepID=A0A9Q9ARX9_9PEZI|nr:Putative sodium/solute symporter, sodium/glucose symporter superfamily [Septoria linicola]